MILKMPRAVDRKARDVGTHDWKAEEKLTRYWLVGVQCSGRLAQAPMRDDSAIVLFVGFREGARHESGSSACYCIREIEIVNRCMLVLVMWSDKAAAELTAAYDSFDE